MLNLIEFIWIWNQIQNLNVPVHHKKMCTFLSRLWRVSENKNGLLMAFRNSGKSTIVGLFCAWVLWCKPDTRILILSADHELAKKMVRNIKRIIERHPLTCALKPTRKEEWASDRFTVVRPAHLRDPSVLARGLMANITGCRADLIICDDVEVPKTCDTFSKRLDLRAKLSELDYILTPCGMMLYVGTPHTTETIYNTDTDGFLSGWDSLKIPLKNKRGQSNWPERFPNDKVDSLEKRSGPQKFSSQMMLNPVPLTDSRLNPNHLVFYDTELELTIANETAGLKLGDIKMVSVSCWWDPSFGMIGKGDNSVIACVFTDENGQTYLHDLQYLSVPEGEENSAAWQCKQVGDFLRRNYIPAVHLETNGIGKFLPALLRTELSRSRIPCAVIENVSHQNKAVRILSAFDALLMNKGLSVQTRIKNTPFITEMREWIPNGKTKDDALDAVAGCLLHEPMRLPNGTHRYFSPLKDWRKF